MPVPALQPRRSTSRSKDLRLGLVREHFGEGLDAEVEAAVREAVEVYESLGATVNEVSLPHSKYGVATYYIIAPCEASSNLARYDGVHYGYRTDEKQMLAELDDERKQLEAAGDAGRGSTTLDTPLVRMYRRSRAEGFGPEVKRRIMLGTYALSAGYYDAYYLEGAQSAAADPPGLRRGVRGGRPDRRPGDRRPRPSSWARRSTTRWRCTWSTCTR